MTEFDLEQTDRLLLTTKQIRKRLDLERAVPREVLLDCIDIASRAPMGSNLERNKWLIVEDPELKAKIAEHYQRVAEPYFEENEAFRADERGARVVSSARYLSDHLAEVPAMVIPLRLDRAEGWPSGDVSGWYGSVLPGVWSFQLALRSRGIGSCWTTLHLGAESEVAELLGIPDTVTQVAMLPVGYYTGDSFSVTPRKPAADITFIDRWGAKASEA
ncbi:MAG: nitroreductase [Verrucomicrobiales bacterium]|jgi:nitroreductase